MSVLFLALGTTRARTVRGYAGFLIARGVGVDLVTVNPEPWSEVDLDPRVRLLTLREGEGRHLLPRTERVLVFRIPEAIFGALHLVRALPGLGRGADRVVTAAQRAQRRLSTAWHERVFVRFYRLVRPYVLWRISRRDVITKVDWQATEQVVICDSHAIPIGWHVARRHPRLAVGFELDRSRYLEREIVDAAADDQDDEEAEPVTPTPAGVLASPDEKTASDRTS